MLTSQVFAENISLLNSLIIEILFVFVAFWRLQFTFLLETTSIQELYFILLSLALLNGFLNLEHG